MLTAYLCFERGDEGVAMSLRHLLESYDYKVFTRDQSITTAMYRYQIEEEIKRSSIVVALWTGSSTNSAWVKDEADIAANLGTLFNLSIGSEPPIGLSSHPGAKLNFDSAAVNPISVEFVDFIVSHSERARKLQAKRLFLPGYWSVALYDFFAMLILTGFLLVGYEITISRRPVDVFALSFLSVVVIFISFVFTFLLVNLFLSFGFSFRNYSLRLWIKWFSESVTMPFVFLVLVAISGKEIDATAILVSVILLLSFGVVMLIKIIPFIAVRRWRIMLLG